MIKFPKFLTAIAILVFFSTTTGKSQLIINELMASNATILIEEDYYGFPDWIELWNTDSMHTYTTSGHYLSDDRNQLKMWQLPETTIDPNDFLLIYCDGEVGHLHANFGLSTGGETVYLSNEAGDILDSLVFPRQYPDVSFGRSAENIDNLGYGIQPTPEAPNIISYVFVPANEPVYSVPAGTLDNPVSLSISGSEVHYTLNGDEPSINSSILEGEIQVDQTMVVKSKNFSTGLLPSKTYANTYFYNEHPFTLPVVSLSFNPEYFYDNQIGIHVRGWNGTAGYCGDVANWNQDWERTAYFEYFDENGEKKISQLIGVKIGGGCTRGRDQKSLKLYARSRYGDNDFDYPFFKQKLHIDRYQSLLLRNSGNDQDQTLIRDAAVQAMVSNAMDIDYQGYQPAIVYFNGAYRGIMNLREKIDDDYFDSNFNLDDDEIDFLERNMEVIRGSADDFNDLTDFVSSNDMSDNANFEHVASQIDIQEFINYFALQIYIGNRDWPQNNLKFWKRKDNGKWRWILFDTDYGFGFRLDRANHDTFDKMFNESSDEAWSTLLFRKLMDHEGFRKKFLANFYTQMHAHFNPDWCAYIIDSLASGIDREIIYNQMKYGRSLGDWEQWVEYYKEQTAYRFNFMGDYTESFFSLQSEPVTVNINNPFPSKGDVLVNEIKLQQPTLEMNTYKELPLTLEAIPASSQHYFLYWKHAGSHEVFSTDPKIALGNSAELSLIAVFAPEEDLPVSTHEPLAQNGKNQRLLKIYPNPSANGQITIHYNDRSLSNHQQFKVLITDLLGKTVYAKDELHLKHQQLDISHVAQGIYFVNVYQGNKVVTNQKMIVTTP